MGLRLYINDDDGNELIEGGAYSCIDDLLNLEGVITKNDIRDNCKSRMNGEGCFMCECWSDTWYKITIDILKKVDKEILNKNQNIISSFLINDEEDKVDVSEWNNIEYLLSREHRDCIWINIS